MQRAGHVLVPQVLQKPCQTQHPYLHTHTHTHTQTHTHTHTHTHARTHAHSRTHKTNMPVKETRNEKIGVGKHVHGAHVHALTNRCACRYRLTHRR